MFICRFCQKEFGGSNSGKNHENRCKLNPDRKMPKIDYATRNTSNQYIKGTAKPWTEEQRARASKENKARWTDDRRKQHSDRMKEVMKQTVANHPESYSYKNFCGRSKKSLYNGQRMHSSWELLVARWLDENSIAWTRKVPAFKYQWQGSEKSYFPDFYLPGLDAYLEVKGYETDRDREKWKSIPELIVLKEKEIKLIQQGTYSIRG